MIRNAPRDAAVYGVDLGKNVFHVVGLDSRGAVVQRVKFRRDTLLAFFERANRTIVDRVPGSGVGRVAATVVVFGWSCVATQQHPTKESPR